MCEEKTISRPTAEHGIHPTQLSTWCRVATEELPTLFSRTDSTAALKAAYEAHVEDLYARIERLTTQVAWLKRTSGLDPGKG